MKLSNKSPELDPYLVSGANVIYYLQTIRKYDEGYTESFIIGVWDSPDGDIDEAAQKVIRQEREFCEGNKFVKPHTMAVRKIKVSISSEVVESRSEHYGVDRKLKPIECANCHGLINYGDEVIIKSYDTCDRYFCCNECLADYEEAVKYSPNDNEEYDKLFIRA
jgi:hypothetical protein